PAPDKFLRTFLAGPEKLLATTRSDLGIGQINAESRCSSDLRERRVDLEQGIGHALDGVLTILPDPLRLTSKGEAREAGFIDDGVFDFGERRVRPGKHTRTSLFAAATE